MSAPTTLRIVRVAGGERFPQSVASLRRSLRVLEMRAAHVETGGMTFLIVTPLGIGTRATIRRMLGDLRIAPVFVRVVSSWPAVSTALYVKRLDDRTLRRALLFERAWARRFPHTDAEAWALPPGSHAQVDAVKRAVRAELPHLRIALGATDGHAVLHPFHLADPPDAALEARRLLAASIVSASAVPSGDREAACR